jgi:hypothetical protein
MRVQKLERTFAIMALWLALFSVITEAKTTSQPFGKMPDGTPVEIFTLSDAPFEARIATYGGIVVSLAKAGRTAGMIPWPPKPTEATNCLREIFLFSAISSNPSITVTIE